MLLVERLATEGALQSPLLLGGGWGRVSLDVSATCDDGLEADALCWGVVLGGDVKELDERGGGGGGACEVLGTLREAGGGFEGETPMM